MGPHGSAGRPLRTGGRRPYRCPAARDPTATQWGRATGFHEHLAGFWQRAGATIIDSLILGVPGSIILGFGFAFAPTEEKTCFVNGRQSLCEGPTNASILVIALLYLVVVVLGVIFYYGQLEGKTGQTVGKRALGIKTVRRSTGEPPGVGRAIGRAFAR